MPPSLHSELGASSASRWIKCPASVRLSRIALQIMERKDALGTKIASIYANEGSVAHSVCESFLLGTKTPEDWFGRTVEYGGDRILVTDEMIKSAQEYVDIVHAIVPSDASLQIERKFSLDWIQSEMFGTCDCAAVGENTLYIFDFKYGKGVRVSAEDNPQLMYYALGVLGEKPNPSIKRVCMTIVQPRVDNGTSSYNISTTKLYKWAEETLKPAVQKALDPNSPCVAGESQCRWCKAASICPEQGKKTENLVAEYFPELSGKTLDNVDEDEVESLLPNPAMLTTDRLERLVTLYLSKLSGFFTDCCEELKMRMLDGDVKKLGEISLTPKKKREIWLDNNKAEVLLSRLLGDNAFERKLISPSKARKLLDKETLEGYTSIPESNEYNLTL